MLKKPFFVILFKRVGVREVIKNLNQEQILPVLQTEGAVLVSAGAGSGKTRLLTNRVAYLIQEKKVPAYNILAITFTNKAANEMKRRVVDMIGEQGVWISTFHALCVRILRRDIDKLGWTKNFSIYADDEKNRLMKEIFTQLEVENDKEKKSILHHISRAKNNNLTPEEYSAEVSHLPLKDEIISAYSIYQNRLKKFNALDFDDLLLQTFILLKTHKEVAEYYQDKFKYIHIDEFQDTNQVQYDIARILAEKWQNIMVVGDHDQCIYGWRGANIENILNFQKDYPSVKTFKLQQNYRSTKNIIQTANTIICNNKNRIERTLWTENVEGDEVVTWTARNGKEEAEFVVRKIVDFVRNKGYSCKDIAILMRLNAISFDFESMLNNAGLPYNVFGGFKFYERAEIKNVVSYLRLLINPADEESLLRIINFPKRGIGEKSIQSLRDVAPDKELIEVVLNIESFNDITGAVKNKIKLFADLYKELSEKMDMPVADFVAFLIEKVDFKSAYGSESEEDYTRRLNLDQFIESVKEYQASNPKATLDEYLQSVMLLTDLDEVDSENNAVFVSTVHAVKGLEFKVVFVVGVEEGIFPIIRADNEDNLEEERRLMYVAITRAKENLFITNSCSRILWGQVQRQEESRFIKESGLFSRKPVMNKPVIEEVDNFQKSRILKQKKDFSLFTKGKKVFHSTFGVGTITDDTQLESCKIVIVNFSALGSKSLSLEYAPLQIMKKA